MTRATPLALATWANSFSMAAWTSGSSTPWSASNTIEPDWPAPAPSKRSSSTSKPRLDSTFGRLKSSR